jgi:hypothetical protein
MDSWNQTSTDAARSHVPDEVNKCIDKHVEGCVRYMAQQDRPEISRYLLKLEKEWDLNRVVTVVGSLAALAGLSLKGKTGRVLTSVAAGLLFQHGLLGFSPLGGLVRKLARVRTRREIDLEKFALKALRGDFERIPKSEGGPLARANAALVAAQS